MKQKHAALMGAGFLLAALLLSACGKRTESQAAQNQDTMAENQEGGEYVKLKAEEALARIDENEKLILVDVRTPEEFAQAHIGNAINIPVEEIGNEDPADLPDKDAEILVYCRSGARSKRAADKLLGLGYTDVKDIGGILDWPYETVAGDE